MLGARPNACSSQGWIAISADLLVLFRGNPRIVNKRDSPHCDGQINPTSPVVAQQTIWMGVVASDNSPDVVGRHPVAKWRGFILRIILLSFLMLILPRLLFRNWRGTSWWLMIYYRINLSCTMSGMWLAFAQMDTEMSELHNREVFRMEISGVMSSRWAARLSFQYYAPNHSRAGTI